MTLELRHRHLAAPVGTLKLVATDRGLRAVLWPVERPGRVRLAPSAPSLDDAVLVAAAEQLLAYFAGDLQQFSLPLDPQGTPFQRSVWEALERVPHGTTTTYRALASSVGRPAAARAVGAAVGRNPLSVVVPCHRVIGGDGSLTGFAGGLEAKRWLLDHERG